MFRRIRILHLINELEIGGAEVLLSETLPKMDRKRFSNSVAYLINKGTLKNALFSAGIDVFDLSWRGRINPFLAFQLMRLIENVKPDIIHTHSIQSDFVGYLTCILKNFKNIVTTQHRAFNPKNKSLFYRLTRALTHHSSVVIAVSNYCRQYLIRELGYNAEVIKVVHNGIDIQKFTQKICKKGGGRLIKIGTLGRLHAQKGLPTLIKAIPYIASDINILCNIPGTGELEGFLKQMVNSLNLGNKVKFWGALSNIEKIKYLQNLDIFIQPSEWEAFGISILEAMAVGLPVIASDLEGIPELVINGKTGVLVKPHNEKDLAQAIITLSKNEKLREKFGKNGRRRAFQFSIDKTVYQLEKIYLNILEKHIT